MKKIEINQEYNNIINEFEECLKLIQWKTHELFIEFYDDQGLHRDEIEQKYAAFRKAKSRKKINIYEIKEYIEYIKHHDKFEKNGYIYGKYIKLGHIEPSTERMLKKLSQKYTKNKLDELL